MTAYLRRLLDDERGEISELPAWTIYAILALAMASVIFLFGRVASTDNTVQAAAYAAARDASLSRAGDAVPHAIAAAETAIGDNTPCVNLDVTIGGNGLTTGLGQAGTVSATVTCTVSYVDLFLPGLVGLPGTFTVTKTAFSPVDPYRER